MPGAGFWVELEVPRHLACRGQLCTCGATLFSGCAAGPKLEQGERWVLNKFPAVGVPPPVAEGSLGVVAQCDTDVSPRFSRRLAGLPDNRNRRLFLDAHGHPRVRDRGVRPGAPITGIGPPQEAECPQQ